MISISPTKELISGCASCGKDNYRKSDIDSRAVPSGERIFDIETRGDIGGYSYTTLRLCDACLLTLSARAMNAARTLRPFTSDQWESFAGAEKFDDGSEPVWGEVTVCGDSEVVVIDARGVTVTSFDEEFRYDTSNRSESEMVWRGMPVEFEERFDLVHLGFKKVR